MTPAVTPTMTRAAPEPTARFVVALDIRYPQAYLALHPAFGLAETLGVPVDCVPLPTATLKPPSEPSPDDDRGTRHRRHRALAIAAEIDVYARAQGLTLREPYRDGDADAFDLAWLWMRERHPERLPAFLFEAFRAYWNLELDVSHLSPVADLVATFEADADAFRSWAGVEGPRVAAAVRDDLHARGVFAVPSYLVEDEVFLGRQHGPMIRWILEGRSGPVPI